MRSPLALDQATPEQAAPAVTGHARAAVRGGIIGNYVDMINIFLPLLALAPATTTLAGSHATASTAALVIAATLIGRPLGAMVFGQIADRVGRTAATQVAIGGTATCSLLIALVPTHAAIGVWSIGLVIALRFVGGMFLAGEYTSAIPLAIEWSCPQRRGLVSGAIMSMAPWAQSSIAFATAGLIALLGPSAYADYGWRIAFVAGGCASLALLSYYRRHVADAPEAARARLRVTQNAPSALGLRAVVGGAWARVFWRSFFLMTGLWLMTNMVIIVLAQRAASQVGLDSSQVAIAMGTASVAQAAGMAMTGHLSTLIGRRRFFFAWGLIATVAGPLLWVFAMNQRTLLSLALVAAALQVLTVCGYGPVGVYLCERFPAQVRSTGYGTAYSLSIIGPALYPLWLPHLEGMVGQSAAVPVVLVTAGFLVAGSSR